MIPGLTAIVGITGIKKVIASAITKNSYFAKNVEDAKDWLAAKAAR